MQEKLIRVLAARRPRIRERWDALLRIERANTPLGHPEMLAHLIDETMDEVFGALRNAPDSRKRPIAAAMAAERAACHCGRNPLLVFFISGEQALLEELIHVQAEEPGAGKEDHAHQVAELYRTVRRLAHHEVDAFCSVCMHAPGRVRSAPPGTP